MPAPSVLTCPPWPCPNCSLTWAPQSPCCLPRRITRTKQRRQENHRDRIHRDTRQGRGSKSLEAHWRRQNHHCEDIMRCLQKGITEQDVQARLNTAKGRVSCTTIRSNEKQHGTTQHNTAHQNTTTSNAKASNNTATSNIRY